MQITLRGVPYEVGDVTHDAPVGYVRELKKISAGKVTIKSIRDELGNIAARLEPGMTEADLLDNDVFLDNFQGMIWLVGRTYGAFDWTWSEAGEEANLKMLMSITEEIDDGDDGEEAGEETGPKGSSALAADANRTS